MMYKQGEYYLFDYDHNGGRVRWKVKLFSEPSEHVIVERLPNKKPILLIGVPITALKALKNKEI